ncbi:hypothetical protein [Okeania sp. SIO2B3]|uniref:hypothetical protein n=1 Tax=Okeania sp. SIO2B3 TaxID=2607784 RepID=UPI0013C0811E|nr:hypothetical protein [Okeania sp. SIO2B3]NET40853.1 hypothetical protein [Okeania sp. SIO2B3]
MEKVPERKALSVAVPDDLMEVVRMLSEHSGKSMSSSLIYIAERGAPIIIDELNKFEIYKEAVAKRKAKESSDSIKTNEVENDGKQKVKEKSGDSKSKN